MEAIVAPADIGVDVLQRAEAGGGPRGGLRDDGRGCRMVGVWRGMRATSCTMTQSDCNVAHLMALRGHLVCSVL